MSGELAAALAKVQAELTTVAKGNMADIKPGFSYRYADLASIAEAVYPLLSKNGLAFIVTPKVDEFGWQIVGSLAHASGETISGSLPLQPGTPQQVGSALTYARRYLLGCLTGVVTDEDDDGEAATDGWTKSRPATPAEDAWTTPEDPRHSHVASSTVPATDAQQKAVHAVLTKAGFAERDAILGELTTFLGRTIGSAKDLTKGEASRVIDTYGDGMGGRRG